MIVKSTYTEYLLRKFLQVNVRIQNYKVQFTRTLNDVGLQCCTDSTRKLPALKGIVLLCKNTHTHTHTKKDRVMDMRTCGAIVEKFVTS